MAQENPDGLESALVQHLRKVLAQIGPLNDQLRAQEQAREGGSGYTVEVEGEHDGSGRINRADRPA